MDTKTIEFDDNVATVLHVEEAIAGASIEISNLRDEYENILTEYTTLYHKQDATEYENERLRMLEEQRTRIERFISNLRGEFFSVYHKVVLKQLDPEPEDEC